MSDDKHASHKLGAGVSAGSLFPFIFHVFELPNDAILFYVKRNIPWNAQMPVVPFFELFVNPDLLRYVLKDVLDTLCSETLNI